MNGSAEGATNLETIVSCFSAKTRGMVDQAKRLHDRLEALSYRLLGKSVAKSEGGDAAEPVRNDTEELEHQLSELQALLNGIESNAGDLETL